MVKFVAAIVLVFLVAALTIGGSPFFAILFILPALLVYSLLASRMADESREEIEAEESASPGRDDMPRRPAGTEADRAHRRERAARLEAED